MQAGSVLSCRCFNSLLAADLEVKELLSFFDQTAMASSLVE